jgi:hypothetical protein
MRYFPTYSERDLLNMGFRKFLFIVKMLEKVIKMDFEINPVTGLIKGLTKGNVK